MDEPARARPGRSGRARAVGALVVAVVAAFAGIAIWRDRHTFVASLDRVGAALMVASFLAGAVGVAATFPVWRNVVTGLGVDVGPGPAARMFFPSQLGKYVPGAVWPIALQVEAGRRFGAARRTMLTAGALSVVLGATTGILTASVALPLSDAHTLSHYWYALLAVPFLLALLHPRALPLVLDQAMRLLHRPVYGERLDGRHELRACGWSVLSWLGLGAQLALLCAGLGKGGVSTFVLCVGAMGLAVSLGVLFIPAPAGAGVREVVLTLALASILHSGAALAVVVASRALLVVADVMLALLAVTLARRGGPADSPADAPADVRGPGDGGP